jgi:hypothetical protein
MLKDVLLCLHWEIQESQLLHHSVLALPTRGGIKEDLLFWNRFISEPIMESAWANFKAVLHVLGCGGKPVEIGYYRVPCRGVGEEI